MLKRFIAIFPLLMVFFCFSQQEEARIREYIKVFTTYPFSDPNPIPLLSPVYPYYRFDGFTDQPVSREWKVVELENSFIKLLILPEIGGKIWTAIEKSTNQPFIYFNHVVKFRDIAMRGPWTSGGLEANYGIIGHTPNCSTPVDYTIATNKDGSVSCFIGGLDLLSRSYWRVEINLPADKGYFTTRSFWYNGTALSEPYYHWMNAGLKAKGDLEFIYPGTKYLGHEGEYSDWPVNKSNNKKISWYRENDFGGYKSYHVFGKYTDFSGVYWHDDDFGMARFGEHDGKAGKKLWIWGLSAQGRIWDKLLTDSDGAYIELQSGRRFNQNAAASSLTPFKQTAFAPYGTDIWKEYWYPVLHTRGFVKANEYGALNIKYEDGWLKIYFSPVQSFSDTVLVNEGEKMIYRKKVRFEVLKKFADSVRAGVDEHHLTVSIGGGKMVYQSDTGKDVLNRPLEMPADFDWNSPYGLYLLGRDAMYGKFYPDAEEKFKAALRKDADFLPALVKMAELLYRNLRYKEALGYCRVALSIDTYDAEANYYYGLINLELNQEVDARDGFDIATLNPEFRSPAYTELAKMLFREKKYETALRYAQNAIDNNAYNMEALQLKAVIYRYLSNLSGALQTLDTILSYDRLNHFAGFEKYLWQTNDLNKADFTGLIRNELPRETFLELGVWYYHISCTNESAMLFSICPVSPEASYWLSFLRHEPIDFSKIDPLLSFPFRSETARVIEELLKSHNNWLLKYHLALIYRDRNRIPECRNLLDACGDEPGFAPFYAVRAMINKEEDAKSLTDLKKAFSLDKQWRYVKLMVEYYINHQEYKLALPYAEAYYHLHPEQYIMGMLYAKILILNGRYFDADKILAGLNIIPFEGATEGRELYREEKLMQALENLKNKNYKKALIFINQAEDWPENLGVGRPYEADIDLRLENWISYLCDLNLHQEAAANQALQRILDFKPGIENTVRNFSPANALVTAWALKKKNQYDSAIIWLEEQIKSYPNYKSLLWSRAIFKNDGNIVLSTMDKDANVRVLEQLIGLEK